jgi:hypothetical protein
MDLSEFSRLKDKANYQRHPWETSRKNVLSAFLKQSKINFPIEFRHKAKIPPTYHRKDNHHINKFEIQTWNL